MGLIPIILMEEIIMELQKLLQALKDQMITEGQQRIRDFKIDLPAAEMSELLLVVAEKLVRRTYHPFYKTDKYLAAVEAVAKWMVDETEKPGLLLMGYYGNGKSTIAKSIKDAVYGLAMAKLSTEQPSKWEMHTAKSIAQMVSMSDTYSCLRTYSAGLAKVQRLIIDDVGYEPAELKIYGNILTPIEDILARRYDSNKITIVTTNLMWKDIRKKYGDRLYDRLKDYFTEVVFEGESFRKR